MRRTEHCPGTEADSVSHSRGWGEVEARKRSLALIERVVRFMGFLRGNGFPVHAASEIDATRALTFIDIDDPFQFYLALRACLVLRQGHIGQFNRLYSKFWGGGGRDTMGSEEDEDSAGEQWPSVVKGLGGGSCGLPSRGAEEKRGTNEGRAAAFTVSARESLSRKDFGHIRDSELPLLEELFKRIVLRSRERKSRRFKPGKGGRVIDLRRSARDCLQWGGEIARILRKERKPRQTRLVLLADVSGSMDVYSVFLIQFVYALQRRLRGAQTFVFGTGVVPITDLLRRGTVRQAMQLVSKRVLFWSGGTDIGGCFQQFITGYAGKYITRNRILVILSDGWDKGDMEVLRSQMIFFKRKFKKIIWLNPHLKYERYQPLCMGMATALPYVDHFLPCHNARTLEQFVKILMR